MKIYRNSYQQEPVGHAGYSFHTSKRDAKKEAAKFVRKNPPVEWGGVTENNPVVETDECVVVPTRKGIVEALNRYASHNDNG